MTPAVLTPRQEPDVIIVGAGTFGSVLAWRLSSGDASVRTLLLESGPLDRTQHVQNAPMAGETVPSPRVIPPDGGPAPAGEGRWRLPWRSRLAYPGLPYGVGGRSLFWGAYCVHPVLDQAGIGEHWPPGVLKELDTRYLPAAAAVLGLPRPVPHFSGELNRRLRERLLTASPGLGGSGLGGSGQGGSGLGLEGSSFEGGGFDESGSGGSCFEVSAGDAARLNMPLAIDVVEDEGRPRLVRFSSAALLAERLRRPTGRLELVTGCHVIGVRAENGRVTALATERGLLCVPAHARVVLAVVTIENARLVLDAERIEAPGAAGIGMTTHLRSNVTVRLPFPFGGPGTGLDGRRHDGQRHEGQGHDGRWGAAALHVRGSTPHPSTPHPSTPRPPSPHLPPPHPPGAVTRFHHQITAFGVGDVPDEVARLLYLTTPRYDVEALDDALREPARHLVVTLASVAEMTPAGGSVTLLPERDEFGARRAWVRMSPSPADLRTWDAMDGSADAALRALTSGRPFEVFRSGRFESFGSAGLGEALGPEARREPLGCGHHEMGSLRMGADPRRSATDADCRLRGVRNLYVAGPAVFPPWTRQVLCCPEPPSPCGSPNTWNERGYRIANAHFRDIEVILGGMRAAVGLVESGRLDPADLLTHRFPLTGVDLAFRAAAERPKGFVKAVIEPHGALGGPPS